MYTLGHLMVSSDANRAEGEEGEIMRSANGFDITRGF